MKRYASSIPHGGAELVKFVMRVFAMLGFPSCGRWSFIRNFGATPLFASALVNWRKI